MNMNIEEAVFEMSHHISDDKFAKKLCKVDDLNKDKITTMLDEVAGRLESRLSYFDLKFSIIEFERQYKIKKHAIGTIITVRPPIGTLPSAYKYRKPFLKVKLQRFPTAWYITNISRSYITSGERCCTTYQTSKKLKLKAIEEILKDQEL